MKTTTNTERLRQIGNDISQWQSGRYPPARKLFLCIWGLPTAASILLVENITVQPAWALVSAFSLFVAWRVTAKSPKTWAETLDKRLSEYQPRNPDAWHVFQDIAQRKGTIELIDIRQWYEHECASSGWPDKQSLRFLNSKTNRGTHDKENVR